MNHNFKLNEEDVSISLKRKKSAPGIAGQLIKLGVVKTESQANLVLIAFIVIGLSAIIYINLKTFGG